MGGKPTAFKHQLGAARIVAIASAIAEAAPAFDRARFEREANRGLDALELKDRVRHVIACLHRSLPQPFPIAVAALERAVALDGQRREGDARILRGFAAWPITDYVGAHGLEHRAESLRAMRVLTPRFSAEFAIRPFLERYPEETLAEMRRWTRDPDHHVRRLASEGARPLLPWGQRLQQFRDDPSPVLAILEELADDESDYVRRSVGNNLNDIAKDHPAVVIAVCERWLREAGDRRRAIVERALRTLVKQGSSEALALLGFDANVSIAVGPLRLDRTAVQEGEAIELSVAIRSTADTAQEINIDYAVHFVKANGSRSPKVFKLKKLELAAGDRVHVRKRHSLKPVTTRVHYPGTHTIEILINGKPSGKADFELSV